jgi:branched-chain amino acid aminotransferase
LKGIKHQLFDTQGDGNEDDRAMYTYYVDGEFVSADRAMIPVDDLALVRGIGVFDLLRTYHGKPCFLKEHVDRLLASARSIDLQLPWSHDEICRVALETLTRNNLEEANIRIIVTGGSSVDFMSPVGKPRLLVLVTALPNLPEHWYSRGIKVITRKLRRINPGAKSINYLPAAMALRHAQVQGAEEVLYLDDDDHVLEGTTSNVFACIEGRLVTPEQGILSGITRKVVLEIAAGHFSVERRDLTILELLKAQEVFITGTNKGLVPVVDVDGNRIGNGRPGPATGRITTLLEARLESELGDSGSTTFNP